MPYKDSERKKEWERLLRPQRLARRRELRRIAAAQQAARPQSGAGFPVPPVTGGGLAAYNPKLGILIAVTGLAFLFGILPGAGAKGRTRFHVAGIGPLTNLSSLDGTVSFPVDDAARKEKCRRFGMLSQIVFRGKCVGIAWKQNITYIQGRDVLFDPLANFFYFWPNVSRASTGDEINRCNDIQSWRWAEVFQSSVKNTNSNRGITLADWLGNSNRPTKSNPRPLNFGEMYTFVIQSLLGEVIGSFGFANIEAQSQESADLNKKHDSLRFLSDVAPKFIKIPILLLVGFCCTAIGIIHIFRMAPRRKNPFTVSVLVISGLVLISLGQFLTWQAIR